MKILKYVLGIVAILIVAFLLFGMFKSEISYDCEVTVDKSLAESWAVSQDDSKMSSWLEGFEKIEPVSGTPGTVGSVSDIHFVTNGESMVIRETITEIIPNESVAMSFTSDFMNMDYKLAMSSVNGKTKIKTSTTCKGNGIISKSMVAMMKGSMQAQEETNLTKLKTTIENNTTNYGLAN